MIIKNLYHMHCFDLPAGGEAGGDIKNCLNGAGGWRFLFVIGVTG